MKITQIQPSISTKQNPLVRKISRGAWFAGMLFSELGLAIQDSFTRSKPYYVEIDGKKIDERELPNAIGRHDYWEGAKWGKIIFSSEDEEIMKDMPREERSNYMSILIRQNKYTLSEPE